MNKPQWLIIISAVDGFYDSGYLECPRCRLTFKLEVDKRVLLGSDVLLDVCPSCETYIIINMFEASPIFIEGYADQNQVQERLSSLISEHKKK
jgi:hypothetical protein